MLFGIVAELLAMSDLGLRLVMNAASRFRRFNDGRHIVSVPINWYASQQHVEVQALGFKIAIVGTNDCGQLGSSRVPHYEYALRVAAILVDMFVNPAKRFRDVANDGSHVDIRQQPIIRRDE